jgi:hypothetical protein
MYYDISVTTFENEDSCGLVLHALPEDGGEQVNVGIPVLKEYLSGPDGLNYIQMHLRAATMSLNAFLRNRDGLPVEGQRSPEKVNVKVSEVRNP